MTFKFVKYFLVSLGITVASIVAAFVVLILLLTIFEYRPADVESAVLVGGANGIVKSGKQFTILSWNVGYGDLGDNADFFMDGGKSVRNSTKERNLENINSICKNISLYNPDVIFIQEIDANSHRSYNIDQRNIFAQTFPNSVQTYAPNFKTFFVPYPLPPIGKVDSGLLTLSRFGVESAQRIKLPSPFKWPVRVANLKRCLLVNRVLVDGTDKELVLVNLHLEAFDSGEGKIAQTNALKKFMNAELEKGNYVIVGGDFNQVFSNTDISNFPQREKGWKPGCIDINDFSGHWIFLQDSSNPTCRANTFPYKNATPEQKQYFVLDGFIVSDNIQVEQMQTIDYNFVNADHNPVLLRVVLK